MVGRVEGPTVAGTPRHIAALLVTLSAGVVMGIAKTLKRTGPKKLEVAFVRVDVMNDRRRPQSLGLAPRTKWMLG